MYEIQPILNSLKSDWNQSTLSLFQGYLQVSDQKPAF